MIYEILNGNNNDLTKKIKSSMMGDTLALAASASVASHAVFAGRGKLHQDLPLVDKLSMKRK
jgi:hypothetical protein